MAGRNVQATTGIGFSYVRVRVMTVDDTVHIAQCVGLKGSSYQVRTDLLPFRGAGPQPGEQWMLAQSYGTWAFCHLFNGTAPPSVVVPPVVVPPVLSPAVVAARAAARAVLLAQAGPLAGQPTQEALNAALTTLVLALSEPS